jgi:hypothetical protein
MIKEAGSEIRYNPLDKEQNAGKTIFAFITKAKIVTPRMGVLIACQAL